MDVTLQAHEAKLVFPVPAGLRELASDISREVLRAQPSHIYSFIADYCSALLRTRDNCIAAGKIVSDILDRDITFAAILERKGLRMEDAHHAATVIQSAFRGFRARQQVKEIDEEEVKRVVLLKKRATTVIQAAFRGYFTRKVVLPFGDGANIYARSPIIEAMLLRTGHSWEDAEQAASCIQRAYRDYIFRTAFKRKSESFVKPMEVIKSIIEATNHSLEEAHTAATVIQRFYRGFAGRNYVKRLHNEIMVQNFLRALGTTEEVASEACIQIQKIFRGYIARKSLRGMREERATFHAQSDEGGEPTEGGEGGEGREGGEAGEDGGGDN